MLCCVTKFATHFAIFAKERNLAAKIVSRDVVARVDQRMAGSRTSRRSKYVINRENGNWMVAGFELVRRRLMDSGTLSSRSFNPDFSSPGVKSYIRKSHLSTGAQLSVHREGWCFAVRPIPCHLALPRVTLSRTPSV